MLGWNRTLTTAAVAFALLSAPAIVLAGFASPQTGNSHSLLGAGPDAFISYTVYVNDGGTNNWITDLGLTGLLAGTIGNTTGREQMVTFYQVTRQDGNLALADSTLGLDIPRLHPWIGGGFLDGTVFNDGTDVRGGAGNNNSVGAEATAGSKIVNVATPTFSADDEGPGASDPTFLGINAGGTALWSWAAGAFTGNSYSPVLFLTSDARPHDPNLPDAQTFVTAAMTGPLSMLVPATNPEPGSLLLLSLGMAGGAGFAWRRRKQLSMPGESTTDQPQVG